jgi:hypothetical protein
MSLSWLIMKLRTFMETVTSLISLEDFSCFLECDAMWSGGYATTFRINRLTISSYTMKIWARTATLPDPTTCNLLSEKPYQRRVKSEKPVSASREKLKARISVAWKAKSPYQRLRPFAFPQMSAQLPLDLFSRNFTFICYSVPIKSKFV